MRLNSSSPKFVSFLLWLLFTNLVALRILITLSFIGQPFHIITRGKGIQLMTTWDEQI